MDTDLPTSQLCMCERGRERTGLQYKTVSVGLCKKGLKNVALSHRLNESSLRDIYL